MSASRDQPPIYGIYRVGNREFVVRESPGDNGTPDFPTFRPPEYDESGRPYVFACNEGCAYFDCDSGDSGRQLCCDCKYLNGDPIGVCMCEKRRMIKEG